MTEYGHNLRNKKSVNINNKYYSYMTDFLTDILNGSNGELLMFAAYWGTEIKRSIRETGLLLSDVSLTH